LKIVFFKIIEYAKEDGAHLEKKLKIEKRKNVWISRVIHFAGHNIIE
jgi:hypothetical protein